MSKSIHKTQRVSRTHFPFEIVIPSYKRQETLQEKTLAVLKEYRIPVNKITVFVANKDEEKIYKEYLDPKTYGKIVVAEKGLTNARNFISDYFPVGTLLVCMDDDIKGFLEYDASAPRKERPLRSLLGVMKRGFQECIKHGCRMWGVYSVPNGFFMKDTVSTDLKFLVGSFWGCVNPGTKGQTGVKMIMDEKEDYYRTIQYFLQDGKVVRLNFVAPKTAYYKESGGMQENPERKKKQEQAVKFLVTKYPEFVALNPTRKSGFMEIRLKDMREKLEKEAKKKKRGGSSSSGGSDIEDSDADA
jgi:hypothetical protein